MSALRNTCTLLLLITLCAVLFSPHPSCPTPPRLHAPAAGAGTAGAGAAVAPAAAAAAAAASPPECYPPNPTSCEGTCREILDKILLERKKSTWLEYYNDVTAEIFRRGVSEGTLVEVGTAYGGLAHHILATHPKMRVIAVDPFFGDYDSGDSMSTYFRGLREEFGQDKFSALWAQAMAFEGGRNFGCRYSLYNTYSDKAAARFPKRSIDMMCVRWQARPACGGQEGRWTRPLPPSPPAPPSFTHTTRTHTRAQFY
jgi:hypothetical protein